MKKAHENKAIVPDENKAQPKIKTVDLAKQRTAAKAVSEAPKKPERAYTIKKYTPKGRTVIGNDYQGKAEASAAMQNLIAKHEKGGFEITTERKDEDGHAVEIVTQEGSKKNPVEVSYRVL